MKLLPLSLLLLASCAAAPGVATHDAAAVATFGAVTGVPSDEVATALNLPFRVRRQGRELRSVASGSAAARLGLKPGDVIRELGGVPLYSQDDLDDVLRVHHAGDGVAIAFHPAGDPDLIETTVTLGGDAGPPAAPGIEWQFASLANLGRAKERAAAENKGILVGLSGAET